MSNKFFDPSLKPWEAGYIHPLGVTTEYNPLSNPHPALAKTSLTWSEWQAYWNEARGTHELLSLLHVIMEAENSGNQHQIFQFLVRQASGYDPRLRSNDHLTHAKNKVSKKAFEVLVLSFFKPENEKAIFFESAYRRIDMLCNRNQDHKTSLRYLFWFLQEQRNLYQETWYENAHHHNLLKRFIEGFSKHIWGWRPAFEHAGSCFEARYETEVGMVILRPEVVVILNHFGRLDLLVDDFPLDARAILKLWRIIRATEYELSSFTEPKKKILRKPKTLMEAVSASPKVKSAPCVMLILRSQIRERRKQRMDRQKAT